MSRTVDGFKIDRDVPMPARGSRTRYPFAEMEVGESVLISSSYATENGVRCAVNLVKKRRGFDFAIRRNTAGLRVWRMK